MKKIIKEKDEEEEKYFSDDYDIIKDITDIHSQETGISKDFVLFNSGKDEKTRTFIEEQYKMAGRFRTLIKDKKIADQVYSNLMREIILKAVLNRNDEQNFLLAKLLKRGQEQPLETQKEEERKGLLDRFLKKEKETNFEEP